MKKQPLFISSRHGRQGFTLVETVIAMGIITIMITAFLAAFGPAVQGIKKSISVKEANRLSSSLEYELSVLRKGEQGSGGSSYSTKFEKAFEWIKESGDTDKNHIVLLYQYRGDPGQSAREDGTLVPQDDTTQQIPGVDYVLQSVVRRLSDPEVIEELQPGIVEGRVFYVRMNQMVYVKTASETVLAPAGESVSGGSNAPGGLGEIIDPNEPHTPAADATAYPEASLAFQARFYALKSNLYSYINGTGFKLDDSDNDGHPDSLGKPIFVRNMAVRR
jgi:prepilin-type N-terminal cleavage/methylation domain-containing protein